MLYLRRRCHTRFLTAILVSVGLLAGCSTQSSALKNDPAAAIVVDTTVEANWPQMGGPFNNHSSPDQNLDWSWSASGPEIVWSAAIGTGYGMPVVDGSSIYTLSLEDGHSTLTARDTLTGDEQWRWTGPVSSYADDYDDYSDGPYSTPVIVDDRVLAITGDGLLVSINRDNGDELQRLDLLEHFDAPVGPFPWGTSPLLFRTKNKQDSEGERRLLINVGGADGAGIVCLTAETLEEVWTATNEGRSYATPRIVRVGDRDLAVVFTTKHVLLLDAVTGAELWKTEFGVRGDPKLRANSVSPLVLPGEIPRVYVTAGPGQGILRIAITSPEQIEVEQLGRRVLDSQFNNLTTDGRAIYGFTSKWNRQAQFRCLDPDSGEIFWEHNSELMRGASALVDGHLVVLGEDGHLAAIQATPEELRIIHQTAEPVIEGPCYAAPVIAYKKLYVRSERELVCFQLAPPADVTDVRELATADP